MLIFGSSYLCTPVWSGLWALLVSELQDEIFYTFLLCILVFSFAFQLWVSAKYDSPKLMEMLKLNFYI